jgi:hypothetical protein
MDVFPSWLAEGILVWSNRDDRTPIELFGAVVEAWEDHLHAFLVAA